MTEEQKDKILKVLVDDRNRYAKECDRRIAKEEGKITGADYMLQRFLDVLNTVPPETSGEWITLQTQGETIISPDESTERYKDFHICNNSCTNDSCHSCCDSRDNNCCDSLVK